MEYILRFIRQRKKQGSSAKYFNCVFKSFSAKQNKTGKVMLIFRLQMGMFRIYKQINNKQININKQINTFHTTTTNSNQMSREEILSHLIEEKITAQFCKINKHEKMREELSAKQNSYKMLLV
jgi:hypothetical protein